MSVPLECLEIMTIGDAARIFGCKVWQLRRLFERGLLPPVARVGVYRVISKKDLPKIEKALREAGYIRSENKELVNALPERKTAALQ